MQRLRIPAFIREVIDDRRQRGILVAGALAMFAVGLVPRVLSPGLPTAQEVIRTQPEVQNLFLLLTFASTATLLLGGLASDILRRRSLLVGALGVMALCEALAIVVRSDVLYYALSFSAVIASGFVLAYAIGSVAVAYEGVPRATALGVVYGAFGAGSALAPAILTLFPELIPGDPARFTFDTRLAYLVAAIAAGIALWAARRWVPAIPGSLPARPRLVAQVALWSISLLAIASGVLGLGGAAGPAIPLALIVGGGLGLLAMSVGYQRTLREIDALRLDRRALAAALAVGMAVGFTQAIPLLLLPTVFEFPLRYGTFFAMLAIAPFAIALLAAGPIAGVLLRRFGPRGMMTLGTGMLGLANLALAGALGWLGRETHYAAFVVPLALIGAGFVLATTVRTAIVFASTPRGLPSMAASINEASVGLGSRIGIVAGTTILATSALDSARSLAAGLPGAAALVEEFRIALVSLGTPRFKDLYASMASFEQAKREAYVLAYLDGVEAALVLGGAVGIGGAVIAWLLTGRRDPLETVFEMQDEREAAVSAVQA